MLFVDYTVDYTDRKLAGTRVETYKALTDGNGNVTRPVLTATYYPDHTTVMETSPEQFSVKFANGNAVRSNWVFDGPEATTLGWPETDPGVVRETVWNGQTTRVYADGTEKTKKQGGGGW